MSEKRQASIEEVGFSDQQRIEMAIQKLIEARGWEIYHTPAQLVSALMVECSELMQGCLWHTPEEVNELFQKHDQYLVKELADIAINYYSIIHYCHLDVREIVENKVDELLERYSGLEKGSHR